MRYMNRMERAGPKVIVMNVVPGQLPINRDGYVPVGYLREVNAGRSGRAQDMDDRRTANRKVRSRSANPFIWRSEGGGAYTISDGNGNTIEMANPGTGAYWYVSAPAWGIRQTRFRTGEEARRFAESLLGVSS